MTCNYLVAGVKPLAPGNWQHSPGKSYKTQVPQNLATGTERQTVAYCGYTCMLLNKMTSNSNRNLEYVDKKEYIIVGSWKW